MALNFTIDPYWTFKHSNVLNNKQIDFDERQQKTNYLYFVNNKFDSLLLGSSRTTYIREDAFYTKVFNYSSNGMYPYEYEYFINIFKKLTGQTPRKIILGVDFFGSNQNENQKPHKQQYYENTTEHLYKLKLLLNYNVLRYSIQNIKQNFALKRNYYNRERIKNIKPTKDLNTQILSTIKYLKNYQYDNNLLPYWSILQNKFQDSEFIVFTTPITMTQLKAYRDAGLVTFYFQWLHDLVNAFGSISHFMTINAYTADDNNFFDSNHFTPSFGKLIAQELLSKRNKIGIILDKTTIDDYIKTMEEKIGSLE